MPYRSPAVLHLDLANKSSEVRTHEELMPLVGGLGWALALFEEALKAGAKDGADAGPVVFATGPLSAVFPGCSKVVAVFRSPQTGFLSVSLGGGHLARFMRFAGYRALVVTGAAGEPTIASIDGEQVSFKDGSMLLGKEVPEVFKLLFGSEGGLGERSVLASGPAAERGVAFSPLYIDEFFSFARGGLGAVFHRKGLKSLVVSGGGSEEPSLPDRYEEVFNSILKKLAGFEELSRQGTLRNLQVERKISGVPFENLAEPNFEDQHRLGEAFLGSRRLACGGCPVGCVHLARKNGGYVPYDYDQVVAVGPLLGITSEKAISQLLDKTYHAGLDPVSLGVILAYLTVREKLAFGNVGTYLTLIDAFLEGKEDWARALREGLATGVETLGGGEFALVLGGMEAAPYFNGYATLLSQILGFSATTEENRGFLLDLDLLEGNLEPKAVVSGLLAEERRKILVELLVGCGYLSAAFEVPAAAFAALEALGAGITHEGLESAVAKVFRLYLTLQKRLGFEPRTGGFPARFFSIPSPQGTLEEGKLGAMVELFKEEVGWTAL